MPTIFGKDKDAIVTALWRCSKPEMGCIGCSYSGRCYCLHDDAVYLAEDLAKALDYVPRRTMLDTLKCCDTCSANGGTKCCIFYEIHGPEACDKIQSDMVDYIEELYSKFIEKYPLDNVVTEDVKPIRPSDILDASTYMTKFLPETKEDKNVDFASAFWKNYTALKEAEDRRRMETHFTPKSIELSADHRTVVVVWNDTEKTIVRLSPNDPDDIYMAFTAALAKKIFGTNSQIKKVIGTHLNEHKVKSRKENSSENS